MQVQKDFRLCSLLCLNDQAVSSCNGRLPKMAALIFITVEIAGPGSKLAVVARRPS
jgi:hypothetical protein